MHLPENLLNWKIKQSINQSKLSIDVRRITGRTIVPSWESSELENQSVNQSKLSIDVRRITGRIIVPSGSPTRGGDVTFMSDISQPSLPTPFRSVLVSFSVSMALSTVFHCINSPDNSRFSNSVLRSYLCLIGPFNYISLYESLLQPWYNP